MCGGFEAGRQAALKASGMSAAGAVDEALAARVRDEIFAAARRTTETLSYKELEEAARNVMNYYMGFRRSMTGMARALEKIRFLSDQASRLHADTAARSHALPRGEAMCSPYASWPFRPPWSARSRGAASTA